MAKANKTSKHARKAATRPKRATWGGSRPRSGRKPSFGANKDVPHVARPRFNQLTTFHVTLRLCAGLPSLRTFEPANTIVNVFARAVAEGRLAPVHWSIQTNHLHLVIEADSHTEHARGMQSLAVRIAKALNRVWRRKGKVFARRYFARAVAGPVQTRNVIRYVLLNRKRHGSRREAVDPFSSGRWFDGWETPPPPPPAPPCPRPVAEPWPDSGLQLDCWRLFGLPISVRERPVGRRVFDLGCDNLLA